MTSKTIALSGAERKVDYSGGTNVWLRNDGTATVYASTTPGITAGADGVVSIPAGQAAAVYGAAGTVFLLGTGSVQLVGSDYTACPFKVSTSASGEGGVDEIARGAIAAHEGNADIHISAAEKASWNGKAELSDIPDKLPADGGNADTVGGKHKSDFVENMLNQNYHFSMVYGDHNYITTEIDNNVPNLPIVSNYTHIVSRRDNGEAETVLSIGADYTKNVYVYRKTDGIWKNLSDGGNATTAITLSDWAGDIIENADDAPLGLSKIDADSPNNPFKFWAGILTLGEAGNQSYRQQWAFPWSNNEAPLKPKYRVKDAGVWGPWQKLNDGGNSDTLDGKHAESFMQWLGGISDVDFLNNANYKMDYHCNLNNGTLIGLPTAGWYHIVYYMHLTTDGYGMQIAYPLNFDGVTYIRWADGTTWKDWKNIADGGNAASVGTYTEAKIAALEARIAALEGGNV